MRGCDWRHRDLTSVVNLKLKHRTRWKMHRVVMDELHLIKIFDPPLVFDLDLDPMEKTPIRY